MSTASKTEMLNPYGSMDAVLALHVLSASEAYVLRSVINLVGTYTFSIWHRSERDSKITFNVLGTVETVPSSTDWKKYVKTVTISDLEDAEINLIPEENVFSFFYEGYLVEGTKDTAWTPAPEDVFSEIERQGIGNWCYNNDLTYINGGKIYTGSITAAQIAANAIISEKIAANAITAEKILAGAIDTDKLASNAVTASKIAAGAVTASAIEAGTITADKISANAITSEKIASNAITSDKIVAQAITTDKIAAGSVTANEIAANSITADKLAVDDLSALKATIAGFEMGENINVIYEVSGGATVNDGEITLKNYGEIQSNVFAISSDGTVSLDYIFTLNRHLAGEIVTQVIIGFYFEIYAYTNKEGEGETLLQTYEFRTYGDEHNSDVKETVKTNVTKTIRLKMGDGTNSESGSSIESEELNVYIGTSQYLRIKIRSESSSTVVLKSPLISASRVNCIYFGKTYIGDETNSGIYIGTDGINTSGDIIAKGVSLTELNRNISEALNGNKIDRKTKVITVNSGATAIELIRNVSATYGEYPVVIATNGDGLANSTDIAATRIQNDICYAILAKAVTTAGNMRINYTVIY